MISIRRSSTTKQKLSVDRIYPLDPADYEIHKQGYLIKSPPLKKVRRSSLPIFQAKYRKRYFIIHTNNTNNKIYFDYFCKHEDLKYPKGSIDLNQITKISHPVHIEDQNRLLIETDNGSNRREYYLTSVNNDEDEMQSWIYHIKRFIQLE
uniref:GRB2 associated binding protein-1 n=1 Tax=Schmidtea mediterranea TaxID=79327 RepID=I1ZIF9_SCHMD|nr:GRB2 associated binding protein-1 [Schmidtea mediterranea]